MTVLERPLTRVEAAEQLGISLSLLDKLTATGQLIPTKIGRRTVYQQQHLRAYLESQAQPREAKTVSHPDEQELAALTVLRAVEHRMQGDGRRWSAPCAAPGGRCRCGCSKQPRSLHTFSSTATAPSRRLPRCFGACAPPTEAKAPVRVGAYGCFQKFRVEGNTTMVSRPEDTVAGQLARRRDAAHRCEPLECGCRDPWLCRCHDGVRPVTELQLDGWSAAALHLLDNGLTPALPIDVQRQLWRRGGDDRRLVSGLHTLIRAA
jgi:hypothetical protein